MRRIRWKDSRGGSELPLHDGDRVAVVGGGPAGSLFTYFFRRLAEICELDVGVDIFEPRRFAYCGPAGCNHCGGIVSESLVQSLAAEGVKIPGHVIQRGIDSYVLHTDVATVRIEPPGREKRIAAVFRGNGPRASTISDTVSFDAYLLELATVHGATVEPRVVSELRWWENRPRIVCADGFERSYDLVVLGCGINSRLLDSVPRVAPGFRPPVTVKTFITELRLGREGVAHALGASMHVFLLDLPGLEFGALIPKGEFVTACLLGREINDELVSAFLGAPEVRALFPDGRLPESACHCFPRINVGARSPSYADRVLMIGDCGVTRLYKDGIGASYRTAKAAATTAVLQGVSAQAFARHFAPLCRRLARDNAIGKLLFTVGHGAQRSRLARRALMRMTAREQASASGPRRLSGMLWDLFTGSSPYGDVLRRGMHPAVAAGLLWNFAASPFSAAEASPPQEATHRA